MNAQDIEKTYIKGSFPATIGKEYPIEAGENKCKEGTLSVYLDTVKKDNKPEVVRCFMQTFDTGRNETGNITMLLTHETVKEIFSEASESLFDSRCKLPLDGNYAST